MQARGGKGREFDVFCFVHGQFRLISSKTVPVQPKLDLCALHADLVNMFSKSVMALLLRVSRLAVESCSGLTIQAKLTNWWELMPLCIVRIALDQSVSGGAANFTCLGSILFTCGVSAIGSCQHSTIAVLKSNCLKTLLNQG